MSGSSSSSRTGGDTNASRFNSLDSGLRHEQLSSLLVTSSRVNLNSIDVDSTAGALVLGQVMEMPTVKRRAALIRVGVISAEELNACLSRDNRERETMSSNAFVFVDAEGALPRQRGGPVNSATSVMSWVCSRVCLGVKIWRMRRDAHDRGSRWFANGSAQSTDQFTWAGCARPVAIQSARPRPEFGAWAYTASPLLGVTRNPWNSNAHPADRAAVRVRPSRAPCPFATASDAADRFVLPRASPDSLDSRTPTDEFPPRDTHLAQNSVSVASRRAFATRVVVECDGRTRQP